MGQIFVRASKRAKAYVRKGADQKGTALWRKNRAKILNEKVFASLSRIKNPGLKKSRTNLTFKLSAYVDKMKQEMGLAPKSLSRRSGRRSGSNYSRFK